jgi:uncharacterized membrane protein
MQSSSFHNWPPLVLLLAAILATVIFVLQIGILGYAYEKIGIRRRTAYLILVLSLLGSYVNVPVVEIVTPEQGPHNLILDNFGRWQLVTERVQTTVALNVGGAIVPTFISIFLLVKNQLYIPAVAGTAFVAAATHWLAEVVPGAGVTVPVFVPPIISAAVAMLLSRHYAAPLAYICGSLGTLVGADLLNLGVLADTGARMVSIGGAGTFDGVFLTGILAVLLAVSPRIDPGDEEAPPHKP